MAGHNMYPNAAVDSMLVTAHIQQMKHIDDVFPGFHENGHHIFNNNRNE